MKLKLIKPRNATKHLLKLRPERKAVDNFKDKLTHLLEQIDEKRSEENQKNNIRDFLLDTYYKGSNEVNTNERADLVIHSGKDGNTPVSVLIETKRPTNKSEMISEEKLNVKAFHEIVLYFLREWFEKKNLEVKYAIITNVNEWYIIDAKYLKSLFADTKFFVDQYNKWRTGQTTASTNDVFYKDILAPFIEAHDGEVEAVYFNINDYKKELKDKDKKNDRKLLALYKLLSPYYLLREQYANDSNSLNKGFYNELLHIVGVKEQKEKGKVVIGRLPKGERQYGSLLENTLDRLETENPLGRVENLSLYGESYKEQQFNVALELCITWVNRVLFLKLLEGQLLNFHKNEAKYKFLHIQFIKNFDTLYKLFHEVLAVNYDNRKESLEEKYKHIPYLNSSLFDFSPLEVQTLKVSSLEMGAEMIVYDKTILKGQVGKGEKLDTLEYLFRFLDAYDFSSVDKEDIQEDKRGLINASVLGKIFEKINGYKDGSIFTPGFITMYMSREALQRAVVQKLNDHYKWDCEEYKDLHNYINIRRAKEVLEANKVLNSLKICDPAVGSGHFLVSVLNELIAIKSDLGLLADEDGKLLKDYTVEVVDDELIVTNYEGEPYSYNPKDEKSLRVQETLFHEKQVIIENCLFGVDINPNSVKICRLRLWIELLKNAYYKEEGVLETLPNIDINIKVGNSLLSRFSLDDDLSEAFKAQKYSLETYKVLVDTYRASRDHAEKDKLLQLIADIKSEYTQTIFRKDPRRKKIADLRGQLVLAKNKYNLFGEKLTADKQDLEEKRLQRLLEQKEKELEEAEKGVIYKNAFEWRFEFPEVLDKDGKYIGFDVVIGNPPYGLLQPNNTNYDLLDYYRTNYGLLSFKLDMFHLFIQKAIQICKLHKSVSLIIPSSLLNNVYVEGLRKWLMENVRLDTIALTKERVFEDVDVHTCVMMMLKEDEVVKRDENELRVTVHLERLKDNISLKYNTIVQQDFRSNEGLIWNLLINNSNNDIIHKIQAHSHKLEDISQINRGLITGNKQQYFSNKKESDLHKRILAGGDIHRYYIDGDLDFVLFKRPKSAGGCWDESVHFAPFKVLIRQIGAYPTATLITEPIAITGNIFSIIPKDIDTAKYILAILNSQLIKYFWRISFSDFKNSFPQVTIFSLKQIPIHIINGTNDSKFKDRIIKNVNSILQAKDKDPNTDTTALESEIDLLVYQLYGLTEEEIKIVEEKD